MPRKNATTAELRRRSVKGGRATGKFTSGQRTANGTAAKSKAAQTGGLDTSDDALAAALKRLKTAVKPAEIRELSDVIERIVFHKQFKNA